MFCFSQGQWSRTWQFIFFPPQCTQFLIPCRYNRGHLGFSTSSLTFSYVPHNRAGLSQPRSSITSQSDVRRVELSVLWCQSGRGEITTTCLCKSTSKTRRRACPDCVQIQTGGRQTDAKKTTNPNKNNSNIYIYIYICDKYRLKSLFDSLPLFSFFKTQTYNLRIY